MRCWPVLIGLLAFSPAISSAAQAPEPRKVNCATTDYPPFTIYDEQQREFSGKDVAIIRALAGKMNWRLNVFNLPWGRVKLGLKKDNFDCFFAMAYEAQRAEYVDYTHYPLHVTHYGVFYKKGHRQVGNKKLAGLNIGVLRGIPLAPAVLNKYGLKNARIVYLDSNETLLAMVQNGRIDASITNYEVGQYLLSRMPDTPHIVSYMIDGYRLPVYLVFKKGRHNIDKIDRVLATLIPQF